MLLDTALSPGFLNDVKEIVTAAESIGFNAVWTSETQHDPFLPGPLISENTDHLQFGTAIAVSFARSPTNLAYTAWDLAQMSGGRFILGLGTQVKAHIVRRFGMPWPDSVVGKLREQIQAIRALWDTWQTGKPLNFRSDYYKLTLMSPFFNPGPIQSPDIPIYIAGTNIGLASLAGEVADGFLVHPFHSPEYLKEVLLPAIEKGAHAAGRDLSDVTISTTAFTTTSPEESMFARAQIAFYASTPSYRRVMAHHGWEDEAQELSRLASRSEWGDMPALISDKMLDTFATAAPEEELGEALLERYAGLADRISLYTPFIPGERDAFWVNLIGKIRENE
ncbi:MAG: TIGR03617 family F420-dependent LLM class oxidoreductase [Gammaproteobacteria bacterium]|nr:TIGR03617 family F420-dependent LLM class oxidoreductase [Gammaproteobacteria bacterium]